jgi:GMP synthase-like glutamine amidotransferase
MILIVDLNWQRASLAYNEFVASIASVLAPMDKCVVKHFLEVTPSELGAYRCVVLSGNALKDTEAIKSVNSFGWIKETDKPILGICAGMQIISLVFEVPLTPCLQIGMTEIKTVKENLLFQDSFAAYALHNYSVEPSETFDVLAESARCIQAIRHKHKKIYGVLFHPEVRNQEILKRFVNDISA